MSTQYFEKNVLLLTRGSQIEAFNQLEIFLGGVMGPFWTVINIFACTGPNWSRAGAIDNPDLFEQVFDTYYILEVPEKIFTHDISMVRRQKMLIFDVLKAFISKFTYYNLY